MPSATRRAVGLIEAQSSEAKAFDDPSKLIRVMTRAAELLDSVAADALKAPDTPEKTTSTCASQLS